MQNTLYYGDNLTVLREHIPDDSVDLVYLDPPFNSNATYNILFKEKTGEESPAQIKAFTDTWDWTQETQRTFEQEIIQNPGTPEPVKDMISAFRQFIGQNAMLAYLVMMTPRLVELRRVLKPTGSLYLHCDPTASHYLKLLLDAALGAWNFKNEITWERTRGRSDGRHWGNTTDTILFYAKSNNYLWQNVYQARQTEADSTSGDLTAAETRNGISGEPWQGYNPTAFGRHWAVPRDNHLARWIEENRIPGYLQIANPHDRLDALNEAGLVAWSTMGRPSIIRPSEASAGAKINNLWNDITRASNWERLGYPTQKPQALLERIIQASSNEGDVVLDPFCGCGTAVAAAQALGRQWIGIDVTHLAVALMKNRLRTAYNLEPGQDYAVVGEPADVGSARALAEQDRFQFQFWALSLLEAFPREEGKRGPDGGIDGVISFVDGPKRDMHKAIVQVKSGHVSAPQIVQLKGVVDREKASLGLFITLDAPTSVMQREAVAAGFFPSDIWQKDYPKIQIRTIEELLAGRAFDLPPHASMYQAAQRVRSRQGYQPSLGNPEP